MKNILFVYKFNKMKKEKKLSALIFFSILCCPKVLFSFLKKIKEHPSQLKMIPSVSLHSLNVLSNGITSSFSMYNNP
jgi:hypothetical protein